ncbi:interleukin-1 receptor accessory protein-like isoform X2 [Corythoichthys intestinalis]|uniref:interleukin-1 receptor accessory protein-like isoform X2 n=1 Tax=Corythoichthys intestinalis TaxID=161448 RepID=UPI0025A5555A|nr:interleukin-1 receptor accessory protein-like isoform X2 [Corythoichthys intestinalis]
MSQLATTQEFTPLPTQAVLLRHAELLISSGRLHDSRYMLPTRFQDVLCLLGRLLVAMVMADTLTSTDPVGVPCHDLGETSVVHVLKGEAAWVSCPLFGNDSSSRDLEWSRLLQGEERPIVNSERLRKEHDWLFFQPAEEEDTGHYICMIRSHGHHSPCSKMAVHVLVVQNAPTPRPVLKCDLPVTPEPVQVPVPLQVDAVLDCPDWWDADQISDDTPKVTWYHWQECQPPDRWTSDREQDGARLLIHLMTENYQGLYLCQVCFRNRGRELYFTRAVNISAVSPPSAPKDPVILLPAADHVVTVSPGSNVSLTCRGRFPYLDSDWYIWWSVDGKTLEQVDQPRFSVKNSRVSSKLGDRVEESVLLIRDFAAEDLPKAFNCSVRNGRGFQTRRARLEEEVRAPTVELACGLGVALVLSLVLLGISRLFWLELLLLYRSRFASDERYTDDKEFDVYISYARNSEEEKFVLQTFRTVLEKQLGYTVCIFDRDSLPGGTITDETLRFVARSRRLVVVLGPGYARQGSQALLELKAGVDGLAGGHMRLILVQYEHVRRREWVRELRRARVALDVLRWRGERSRELTSRFWKEMRVALPVRKSPDNREAELKGTNNRERSPLDV